MPNITAVFLWWTWWTWWTWLRAVLHRGYWPVASRYLVVNADLSAFQLVFPGTAREITAPRRTPGNRPVC